MKADSKPEQKSIRISFFGLMVGLLLIFVVGIFGGLAGRALTQPQSALIRSDHGDIVPVVQEVTISPSQAAADIAAKSGRSVFALVRGETEATEESLGTLLLLTNDGLAVTAGIVREQALSAVDDTGRVVTLTRVGEDAVFGLTYFRLTSGVFVPLELRGENAPTGSRLLGLTRRVLPSEPVAFAFSLREYQLPERGTPIGQQQMMRGEGVFAEAAGAPLLDDEGRVGGILIDGEEGLSLPVSAVRESFERLVQNTRERNPFEDLGLTVVFDFVRVEAAAPRFVAQVSAVKPASVAAAAGLKSGDSILAIGEQDLTWQESVVKQFSQKLPLSVTVKRPSGEHTLTFSEL